MKGTSFEGFFSTLHHSSDYFAIIFAIILRLFCDYFLNLLIIICREMRLSAEAPEDQSESSLHERRTSEHPSPNARLLSRRLNSIFISLSSLTFRSFSFDLFCKVLHVESLNLHTLLLSFSNSFTLFS